MRPWRNAGLLPALEDGIVPGQPVQKRRAAEPPPWANLPARQATPLGKPEHILRLDAQKPRRFPERQHFRCDRGGLALALPRGGHIRVHQQKPE